MITGLVSSEEIKNKAIVDSGLQMQDIPQRNFNRWIVEAMYHIGGTDQSALFRTDNIYEVEAVAVNLHDNVVSVRDVWYTSKALADVPKTIDGWQKAVRIEGDLDTSLDEVQYIYVKASREYGISLRVNRLSGCVRVLGSTMGTPDNLTSSIMVPDSMLWQEAIYWYLMMKMDYIAFRKNPQRKMTVYQHSQMMFSQFAKSAYAEALFPDADGMDRLAEELSLGVCYSGLRRRNDEMPGPAKPVDHRL